MIFMSGMAWKKAGGKEEVALLSTMPEIGCITLRV
jgi:hypothetical protein